MSIIFNWKPDDDQVYIDDYGSQTQLGSGVDFNKYNGRFFIMDARDCTLTLKATENTSPNFTSWPDKRSGFGYGSHPEIIVRQGAFQIIGLSQFNCGSYGDPIYPDFVNISVSDSGHFTVGSQFVYFSSLKKDSVDQPKVTVTENGKFDVDADYIFASSGWIDAADNAVVNFTALQFFAEFASGLPTLTLLPRFTLGAGSPVFNFIGTSPDVTIVDFMNETYQEGLFNFKSDSKGKFVFKGIGNAFQQTAMLNYKLIAVDGIADPAYVKKKLNMNMTDSFVNGDLVVQLK